MKNVFKMLAVAAALALPSVGGAQAPIDETVTVNLKAHPFATQGTGFGDGFGGGFTADFSIDFGGGDQFFSDYLVWCIDPNREAAVGNSYSYTAYTATNFAATPLGSTKPNDLTDAQMRSIVSLVNTLQTGWNGFSEQQRRDLQGSIWSTFRGEVPLIAGNANADLGEWIVLYGNRGNQTFLTRVPEPSDFALLLVGFTSLGVMMIARRRRA
jgi:hypothetical protein